MEARNCPRCHKMFSYIRSPICPSCEREEETIFNKLKDYIHENPMCTLRELSEATGILPKRITGFIREGRLEISKGMIGDVQCESCGRPILRGRYCDKCVLRIHNVTEELFNKGDGKEERSGAKMHIKVKKRF